MKLNKIYTLALAALSLAACSPEDFDGVSEAGLPVAENAKVTATVDEATNTVTFNLEGDGIYPMWYIPVDGKEVTKNPVYSTLNPLQKIWSNAGDYKICYRVGNHNGLSQGMGETTFHIANSLTNYDELLAMLCGKEWRIASTEAAHMGCGPSGTDGTEWWSAKPNDKAGFGVYDDRISFGTDYSYTYDPGEGGTVYVNKDCSVLGGPQSEDFMATVDGKKKSSFKLSTEGEDIYMTMPAGTYFPYIPADGAFNGELKLRIESLVGSTMTLVWDNGEIAWHYILTNADEGFQGFNAASDCNLWKSCQYSNTFFYAPGWAQIADPTVTADGNKYVIELPTATTDQWQAQVHFHTDMATNADNSYDFSAKLLSSTDHNNVTVKLTKEGDDNTYYFVENIQLKAGQEYIFYKSNMAGIDMDKINLVFDFGGNAENTKITVRDIDLQEHGCDGIEAPAEDEDKTVYTYDSESNLWKTYVDDKGNEGFTTTFYYAPGWTQIADPDFSVDNGKYTVVLPEATSDQWQAQVHVVTSIPAEADTEYDFSCKFLAKKDINGVTVKLTDTTSDDNFFFANRYDLKAGTEYQVKIPAVKMVQGKADALKLVFDFGGCPADEKIDIYNIILQKTAK